MFTQNQIDNAIEDMLDESSVFSYLSASADTDILVATTWYPIQGAFVNDFNNFELDTDKIKYIGENDYKFEIDWHTKLASDSNSATMNITISINGTPVETTKMGAYAKTSGEPISFSGTEIVTLTKNDTIQIVIQSDKVSTVTVGSFVTSLNKFVPNRK